MLAPPPLAILTMRPQRRAIIPGKARWAHRIWPCRFTSIVRHHAPTSLSAKGPSGPTTPALLTSRSIGPSALDLGEGLVDRHAIGHVGRESAHLAARSLDQRHGFGKLGFRARQDGDGVPGRRQRLGEGAA